MSHAAMTHGRKFELFNGNGGHGGPYHTLASALRTAIRLLEGCRSETRIVIRDRSKCLGQFGYNVAVVEKSDSSIDVVVLDDREHIARQSFGINHSRAVRRDRFKNVCRRGNDVSF